MNMHVCVWVPKLYKKFIQWASFRCCTFCYFFRFHPTSPCSSPSPPLNRLPTDIDWKLLQSHKKTSIFMKRVHFVFCNDHKFKGVGELFYTHVQSESFWCQLYIIHFMLRAFFWISFFFGSLLSISKKVCLFRIEITKWEQ